MSDEVGRPVTEREWKFSLDSHLREHELEARNRANLATLLDAMRVEAKAANDLRLESMNDLRRQLDRQSATFVTFERYDSQSRAGADAIGAIGKEVDRRLSAIESRLANMDGKTAAFAFVAAIASSGITSLIVYAVTQ